MERLLLGFKALLHHDPIHQPSIMLMRVSCGLRLNLGALGVVGSDKLEVHSPITNNSLAVRVYSLGVLRAPKRGEGKHGTDAADETFEGFPGKEGTKGRKTGGYDSDTGFDLRPYFNVCYESCKIFSNDQLRVKH